MFSGMPTRGIAFVVENLIYGIQGVLQHALEDVQGRGQELQGVVVPQPAKTHIFLGLSDCCLLLFFL
jgi:hypothetical protein